MDFIIGMDAENLADLQALAPAETKAQLATYLSVVPGKRTASIPDPWYTGNFNETYQLITEGLPYWLAKFENK